MLKVLTMQSDDCFPRTFHSLLCSKQVRNGIVISTACGISAVKKIARILEYGNTGIYTGIQEYRNKRIQEYRNTGIQEYRNTGIQEYRNTGIREYGNTGIYTGIQEYRNTGIQEYRNTGIQE